MTDSFDIQRAFRFAPGLFLILKAEAAFTIVGASDDFLRATRTDVGMFGKSFFDVFQIDGARTDAGAPALVASFERVVSTGLPDAVAIQRYDARSSIADDVIHAPYWASVNAPVLAADGSVDFIIHRIEVAGAKANLKAVEILESITEGFFSLDGEWRFDYINGEACRILNRQAADLAGKVLWDEYPGLESTDFERIYRLTMVKRESASFTGYYAHHDRWYEVTTFPTPDGISVYFRNVTAQKAGEAERDALIRESENQRRIYETALDSTPDFFYVFDLEHRALYANEALRRTWGVDDVRGKKWMDLGYEQWHADRHDGEIDEVISTRASVRNEIPFTGTNGTRLYDYIFSPVINPDGEVVAVAGTTRDITDRHAAEQSIREQAQRLAESDLVKDEFLATLSHELRNPLAPLRNSIEVLRRTEGGHEPQSSIHAMMERQVNHLVRLVDDLLEVSRISRGTLSLRHERIGLDTVVRSAVETIEPLLTAAGHTLDVELPDVAIELAGDPVRLAQILANLLNNAAKYTPHKGHIVLRVTREDDMAVVRVKDNGIGITAELMPRIFDMFTRGDRDSAHNQGGLGIGLALSRQLALLHNGTLEARSDGLGKGSELTLRLPLAAGVVKHTAATPTEERSLSGMRVLVVDDNHDAGDSLSLVLEMLGAQVSVARDGAEALELFPACQPTVVLLDIGMPGMNGYDVARAMRSGFPASDVTLIALTGWGQADDLRRARDAGFAHHLVKPVEIEKLHALLLSLLQVPH
jgi:PAS domain S-box-containing protein